MRIGIVGAGGMGTTLARHLHRLGHDIAIASPRGPGHVVARATEIGVAAASIDGAVHAARVVILAIPTKLVSDLPRSAFASLASSAVVIDLGNYHPELRDGHIDAIDQGLLDSQGSRSGLAVPWSKHSTTSSRPVFSRKVSRREPQGGSPCRSRVMRRTHERRCSASCAILASTCRRG